MTETFCYCNLGKISHDLTKQKPELLMQLLFHFMHFHFHQCVICYDVTITFTVRSLFVSVYCACLLGCILYRMITAMTNSLLNTKLELNTSSVPRSEQASPYNFPIHCLSKWWCIYKSMLKYAEIAYTGDITYMPSILDGINVLPR